jgi:SAM-dependent methyltransferase
MPDVWSMVAELDPAAQERLAAVLETRGADPQQQAMRRAFLGDIRFPARARVLEVGCGTGVMSRVLARWPEVGSVVGVDPARSLLCKARELAAGLPNLSFQEADGRSLPFDDESFDAVIFDSTLSHVPAPEQALRQAARVLRPLGWLGVFDGDYATTTVAIGEHDPLQACADAMMAGSVNDRWVARRLPALARSCRLQVVAFRSHGFVDAAEPTYMLTIIDRGADILAQLGRIGPELASALKAEGRRRAEAGAFYGQIAYAHLVARKPG